MAGSKKQGKCQRCGRKDRRITTSVAGRDMLTCVTTCAGARGRLAERLRNRLASAEQGITSRFSF